MTLDEAIEYYTKVATQRAIADEEMGVNDNSKWNETKFMAKKESEQIIADNQQLAEWLTELKETKRLLKSAVVPASADDTNVGHKSGGWISVKDRLPDDCVEVLVYDTDCGIVIGWYDKEIGDFAADFISPLDAVTHWMPLPKSPKDGDTND